MEARPKNLVIYQDEAGNKPFDDWLDGLGTTVMARVLARLGRVEHGNFGDCKPVGDGVSELKLPFGSGYRVYFAEIGNTVVLLLSGGDKGSQSRDIRAAKKYLEDYRRRSHGKT